jgi:hypothetical protein
MAGTAEHGVGVALGQQDQPANTAGDDSLTAIWTITLIEQLTAFIRRLPGLGREVDFFTDCFFQKVF